MRMHVDPDIAVIELAARQYGVFGRSQALGMGHTPRTIHYRLSTGRWEELYPKTYAIAGGQPSWERSQLGACIWSGGISAGQAAGHLFELPGCDDPAVEVLTTERHRAVPHSGAIVHVTNRLPVAQRTMIKQIPTTSIERTLLDLCGDIPRRRAAIALDDALLRRLTNLGSLDHCLYLTARQGRDGCKTLRELVRERESISGVPNSPLETVIFELLAASGLPLPQLQVPIYDRAGNFIARPDFLYSSEKLVIEGHSRKWHGGHQARKEDLVRNERLCEAGFLPIYLSWADATTYGEQSVRRIEGLLAQRRVLTRAASPQL
jgi:hypothetical protein